MTEPNYAHPDHDPGYPQLVPDLTDVSDFPHTIGDGMITSDLELHPSPKGVDPHGIDTFYGIQHDEGELAKDADAHLHNVTAEDAVIQDMRWHNGLVVLPTGCKALQAQYMAVASAIPQRIIRESKQRRNVLILNPAAPLGDGVSILWIGSDESAKPNNGWPLLPGASVTWEYSGDIWASTSGANTPCAISAPMYSENDQ